MVGRSRFLWAGAAAVIVALFALQVVALVVVVGRPWWRTADAALVAKLAWVAHLEAAKQAHYPSRSGSSARPDYATAVREYRLAIETTPRLAEAHLGLISATRSSEFARSIASGSGPSDARSRQHALEAAGRASLLAFYAAFEFYRRAAAADPSNAEFAYQAAVHIAADDRVAFDRAADDILSRFPRTNYAPFILGAAARRAPTADDALRILERQHRDYPDPGRALSLFRGYLDVDADRAMTFARSVVEWASQSWVPSMWKPYMACGEALLEARRLAGAGDHARARTLLDKTTSSWPCSMTPLHLERARTTR